MDNQNKFKILNDKDYSHKWSEPSKMYYGYISLMSSTKNSIFAGSNYYGGPGGIHRSSDNGNSWQTVIFSMWPYFLAEFNGHLLLTSDSGVYCSIDDGKNWLEANNGLPNVPVYCLTAFDKRIYAGTYNNGLYFSDNYGEKWFQMNNCLSGMTINSLNVINDVLFAGTENSGIYKSIDSGINWVESNFDFNDVKIINNNGSLLFAVTQSPMIKDDLYYSDDIGETWKLIKTDFCNNIYSIKCFDDSFILCTDKGLYASDDVNGVWKNLNTGLTDIGVFSVTNFNNELFIGTVNGIYVRREDKWKQVGLTNNSFLSAAYLNSELFVGSENNGLFSTLDNGDSWNVKGLCHSFMRNICKMDSSLYLGTDKGVYLYKNGASTLINEGLPEKASNVLSVASNSNYLFAGFEGFGVFRKKNDNDPWHKLPIGPEYLNVNCFGVNGENIYAGTESGIIISNDNGNSWNECNNGLVDLDVKTIYLNGSDILAGFHLGKSDGGLYKSSDLGKSWSYFSLNEFNIYSIVSHNNILLVGNDLALFASSDNGKTWVCLKEGCVNMLFKTDEYLFGCFDFENLWKIKLSDIII